MNTLSNGFRWRSRLCGWWTVRLSSNCWSLGTVRTGQRALLAILLSSSQEHYWQFVEQMLKFSSAAICLCRCSHVYLQHVQATQVSFWWPKAWGAWQLHTTTRTHAHTLTNTHTYTGSCDRLGWNDSIWQFDPGFTRVTGVSYKCVFVYVWVSEG